MTHGTKHDIQSNSFSFLQQKCENGLYTMSGGTGSRRFMAPEVALNEPYNLSADIYSFGILMWEILTLQKAFAYMSADEHRERVIINNERPELDPQWSFKMKDLFEACWTRSPFERPAARDVYKAVRTEIQTIYREEFAPVDN
jgi:serine/threonine protein kinase